MGWYRTKPCRIEAIQYDGRSGPVLDWLTTAETQAVMFRGSDVVQSRRMCIHTLEGVMEATPGDFIIRGLKGELYPCKPDVFAMKYEAE